MRDYDTPLGRAWYTPEDETLECVTKAAPMDMALQLFAETTDDIEWTQIKDAGKPIFTSPEADENEDASDTEEEEFGEGEEEEVVEDPIYFPRLQAIDQNLPHTTIGEVLVNDEEGSIFSVKVDKNGMATETLKLIENENIADGTITGAKLEEGTITSRELDMSELFESSAQLNQMLTANLDVQELFRNEEFAQELTEHILSEEIIAEQNEILNVKSAVAKAGDEMEGPLTLSGAPTQDMHAATKQYVDTHAQALSTNAAYGHAMASSTAPKAHGTASVGTETAKFARGDHVHPVQTSITGNAGSATQLQNARMINGTSFNGTADITFGRYFATAIVVNDNLNNYTNEGFYYCSANATAATLTNCPTANAFSLQVVRHAGVCQRVVEYMPTGTPKVYFRNYYNGTWLAWAREYTTLDKPTPTDIGAAPTSHASTGTSYGVASAANYGHAMASSATPSAAGTATIGTDNGKFAREGHVHPAQTTVSGNAGTATKLQASYTIGLSGGATGTATEFNGSKGITIPVTALDVSKVTTGTLPVANGGTGQTTAAGVRNSLGLGNTTGALPVANGGTGQTTSAGVRNSLGLGNTTGALPIANGGTGATTAIAARKALLIQTGLVSMTVSLAPQARTTIDVTFSPSFSTVPRVIASATASSSGYIDGTIVNVRDRSETGFTVSIFNPQAVNTGAYTKYVQWIAIEG